MFISTKGRTRFICSISSQTNPVRRQDPGRWCTLHGSPTVEPSTRPVNRIDPRASPTFDGEPIAVWRAKTTAHARRRRERPVAAPWPAGRTYGPSTGRAEGPLRPVDLQRHRRLVIGASARTPEDRSSWTEMGRNRRRIDESPDKRRDRRDPHSLLPAGYMNARSGSILAVKRAASTSESPGCSRGAASAWAIPRRCLRSAICVAWPEAWDHCGTEQMVVSMRKFDCTVWRSAWKTSSG